MFKRRLKDVPRIFIYIYKLALRPCKVSLRTMCYITNYIDILNCVYFGSVVICFNTIEINWIEKTKIRDIDSRFVLFG